MPWAIQLWGAERHPTQIYEVLLAAASLVAIGALRQTRTFAGVPFLAWIGMVAASRVLREGFRRDSVIILGGLRAAQLASLAVLAAAIAGIHLRARIALAAGRSEPGPAEGA